MATDIAAIRRRYDAGKTVVEVLREIFDKVILNGVGPVWISIVPHDKLLERCAQLDERHDQIDSMPLYGIPFAVKDNIDVAGLPTTAGCPSFAYTPSKSATVIDKLEAAGAVVIGKTNMDQFATGLVGTRTPYGMCSSVFDSDYVSGGSSSGSAVAVASGLVSFSLGTDTAGSGRVPAAFNNIVGLKPTPGVLSISGVVPACKSLDCISIFALTSRDAEIVFEVCRGYDESDAYSSPKASIDAPAAWLGGAFRFGVPKNNQLEFFGDQEAAMLYNHSIVELEKLGGTKIEFELQPFLDVAKLLYSGPWVAERLAAVGDFLARHADDTHPIVREIILSAMGYSAADAFKGQYQLEELRKSASNFWNLIDIIFLPTTGTHYKIADVLADPYVLNANLGRYTNFVNLLDMCAMAVPAGLRTNGLPFGVTLMAPTGLDKAIITLGDKLHRSLNSFAGSKTLDAQITMLPAVDTPPVPPGCVLISVVGAHLTGQPLNHQLTSRGARLVKSTKTDPGYKLFALANTAPPKPGLVREPGFVGSGIEIEIWAMPVDNFGSFVAEIPSPLGIGKLQTITGELVPGFICEPQGLDGAIDITHFGGWRAYLASKSR